MSSSSAPLSPRGAEEDEEGAARTDGGGTVFCYGEAGYWDARYVEEGGAPYDWYQRYAALRPFVRRFVPPASRLLMIGCGSARTHPLPYLLPSPPPPGSAVPSIEPWSEETTLACANPLCQCFAYFCTTGSSTIFFIRM
jgi:hypothetical protein